MSGRAAPLAHRSLPESSYRALLLAPMPLPRLSPDRRHLIRCIVAATNSNGEPDLFFVKISASAAEIELGAHFDTARGAAEAQGYKPALAFDETNAAGRHMLPLFAWDTASIASTCRRLLVVLVSPGSLCGSAHTSHIDTRCIDELLNEVERWLERGALLVYAHGGWDAEIREADWLEQLPGSQRKVAGIRRGRLEALCRRAVFEVPLFEGECDGCDEEYAVGLIREKFILGRSDAVLVTGGWKDGSVSAVADAIRDQVGEVQVEVSEFAPSLEGLEETVEATAPIARITALQSKNRVKS